MQPGCRGGKMELFLAATMLGMQFKVYRDQGEHWREEVHFGSHGEVRRLLYSRQSSGTDSHYDILLVKERWAQEQALQAAELKVHKMREVERVSLKQACKDRESRIQASMEEQRDQAKARRRKQTQESRIRGQASLQLAAGDSQETLDLLLEVANQERYCVAIQQGHTTTRSTTSSAVSARNGSTPNA